MDYANLPEKERTFEFEKDKIKRKFIFDTELMTLAQIADANTRFGIYETMMKVLPENAPELQESIKKQALHYGLAALMVEVNEEDLPITETYDLNTHTGKEVMQSCKGLDLYQRLEGCRASFFIQQGHYLTESIKSSIDIIKELKKHGKDDTEIKLLIQALSDPNSTFELNESEDILNVTTKPESTEKKQAQL